MLAPLTRCSNETSSLAFKRVTKDKYAFQSHKFRFLPDVFNSGSTVTNIMRINDTQAPGLD